MSVKKEQLRGVAFVVSAALLGGCRSEIDGINMIDCANGPKESSVTLNIPDYQTINVGDKYIKTKRSGAIAVLNQQVIFDNGNNNFRSEKEEGAIVVNNDGIIFESTGKHYNIKFSTGNKPLTTEITIKTTCVAQTEESSKDRVGYL